MRFKRNEGQHTVQHVAEQRILEALADGKPSRPSSLGYVAFPDYRFKTPQGAAFAVSRILRSMHDRKVIQHFQHGYRITEAGRAALEAMPAAQPSKD